MKRVMGFALLAYSSLCMAGFPGKLDVYSLLLVSDNPDNVKMGARSIDQDGVKDPAIMDLVAERFCIYVNRDANMDDKNNLDTVSWLAVALGDSGNTKYRPLLEEALQKTHSDKNRKYLGKAIKALPGGVGGAYKPVCPSFDDLRSQTLSGRVAAKVSAEQLSSLKEGESLDAAYQALGAPSDVKQYIYETFRPFIGRLNLENIEVFYGDAGSVRFDYSTDHWEVSKVLPTRIVAGVDPNSPNSALIQRILSADPEVYTQVAQDLIDNKQFSTDVLDVAARRVWLDKQLTDRHAVDGLSWLCKDLGASGNARYRTVLAAIADKAADSKLRKYAKQSLGQLPGGDAEQLPIPGN